MNYPDPENVPPVWQVGDVILDRYEVKQVFTGGGMGLVYRVHHRDWAIDLAVKSPRPEFFQTQQHIENFEREAETWVNLGLHPHTVSCYYVRRLGGIPRIFADAIKRHLRPELLNRISRTVVFNPLSKENVREIAEKFIARLNARLSDQGIEVGLDESVYALLMKEGYSPEFGARQWSAPLKS